MSDPAPHNHRTRDPHPHPRPHRLQAASATAFALLGLLAGCPTSTQGPPQPQGPPSPVIPADSLAAPLLAAGAADATFHGHASERVLAAAMTYPSASAASEPEVPLSLTASDGTGLALVKLDARAVIDGPIAFTELHLRFHNPNDRVIEGRFAITLPPEATISRLAMLLSTGWQEAEMVERQKARAAYEDFLHRRQDPALLEKEAGNEFRARIFPIPARGDKDIIISYSQPLVGAGAGADGRAHYRLPLRGLPEVAELHVSALVAEPGAKGREVGYRRVAMDERGVVPTKDFEVEVPAALGGIASGEIVAARVAPEVSTAVEPMDSLVVLVDTSASRAPGFSAQVRRLGELMDALEAAHGGATTVHLAAFDQLVVPVYAGPLSGFGQEALDRLRAHRPLGASNLDAALAWVASQEQRQRLLIVSDAIPTMGATSTEALIARLRQLGPATRRVDLALVGGIRDEELARSLARGILERDGVVALMDSDDAPGRVADKMAHSTVSGVKVNVAGAEWVWPQTLDGLQPGDEVLVFASLGRASAGESARITLSGGLSQDVRVPLARVPRPLIERAAVAAHIARLGHERDTLAPERREQRDALKQRIIELSTRYRVLSDHTALLVLETEDDYQRYGIDRRSLADILTVGEKGVDVIHRSAPVLLVADANDATTKNDAGKQSGKGRAKKPGPEKKSIASESDASRSLNGGSHDDDDDDDGKDLADKMREESKEKAEEPEEANGYMDNDGDAVLDAEDVDQGEGLRQETVIDVTGRVATPRPVAIEAREMPPERMPEPAATVQRDVAAEREPMAEPRPVEPPKPEGPPPYDGKMAEVMDLIARRDTEAALIHAIRWQSEEPGDVMALLALGEALEHSGKPALAARAYGSIIDLFPSRADMRRFAAERLERLDKLGLALAVDSYAKAAEQRPDHLTGHRLLAFALERAGDHANAFKAVETGLGQRYPEGRFSGGTRILREDLGLIAASWIRAEPGVRASVLERLAKFQASLPDRPSLRFVLNWETDANDVDFHIYDGRGGHAYYSDKNLPSGGQLYEDVTTGYGPECFTIEGTPGAYPYHLQIHYYSRGPMGYGMGKLEIVEHDGRGNLRFEERPFVVMNDGAFVDLGTVAGATMAR